jgi:hypothetical protein
LHILKNPEVDMSALPRASDLDDSTRIWSDAAVAQILSELLDRPITARTLSNWRYQRRGPKPEYFDGGRPTYTVAELRRYAREIFKPQAAPRSYRRSQKRDATEGDGSSPQV